MGNLADGLPRTREEWPPEVLQAAALFASGDVVQGPPYFYFANPKYAVLERTKKYKDGSTGPEIIDASRLAAPYGVITSQTCDVGEIDFEYPSKPFIFVAPVFDGSALNGGIRKLLSQGKAVQGYLLLPALSDSEEGFWVADLRLEMPIEKSWLVGRSPIKGFYSEDDARKVAELVAALRTRPAWAEVIRRCVDIILLEDLKRLKAADAALYSSVKSGIEEIGVHADSRLNPTLIELAAFSKQDLQPAVREWWNSVSDKMREAANSAGIQVLATDAFNFEEISAAKYLTYVTVDLSRHSPQ